MSLLIAPYNNAMRLGQGFNSYTQQICVDDAVVIDPERAENILSNDGSTMRTMAQMLAKPSAWTRQKEVVLDKRAQTAVLEVRQQEIQAEAHLAQIEESPAASATTSAAAAGAAEESPAPVAAEAEEQAVSESPEAPATAKSEEFVDVDGDNDDPSNLDDVAEEGHAQTPHASQPRPSASAVGKAKLKAATGLLSKAPRKTPAQTTAPEEDPAEVALRKKEEQELLAEQRAYQKELAKEAREDERERRKAEREEQKVIAQEKREFDRKRREEMRQKIDDAASSKAQALSLQDLEKIKAQNQFLERFNGMPENESTFTFDPTARLGPSQTVTFTSRFVDKLSDVTDDMCISGSLSIKAAKIGGSGKGSFVDSDKFKESDLNFFISVKVVNQTVNFKDALVFNPLRSVNADNFQKVYGDSFVSGFLEGGEFNAIVSMKIHNKAKMTDIKAEAKVALTAGPVDITAEANVGIARANLETNTETTIQVSWAGGGQIKPMEQQWDIKSLMAAAARFPDLVAQCPQRTYAILTKYDTLRSFIARQPASYTPLQYENAQIYTNALLDSFMSYKTLYKQLGEHISNIQNKILEVVPWEENNSSGGSGDQVVPASLEQSGAVVKKGTDGFYPFVEDLSRFDASIKGLSDARKAIRRQMARIVNEVDVIEKDPKLATDEDHKEPFQSPAAFETRVPKLKVPDDLLQSHSDPLTGKRIMAKTQTEEELKEERERQAQAAALPSLYEGGVNISMDEQLALDAIKAKQPHIGEHLRVSSAFGTADKDKGAAPFSNLDFLQPEWMVRAVSVEVFEGALASISITYDNGLISKKGATGPVRGKVHEITMQQKGERFIAGTIVTGVRAGSKTATVLALRLYTNRGRRLLAGAETSRPTDGGKVIKDGVEYEKIDVEALDVPFQNGTLKGFFGDSVDGPTGAICRLGLVWGDLITEMTTNTASAVPVENEFASADDLKTSNQLNTTELALQQTRAELEKVRQQTQAELQQVRQQTQAELEQVRREKNNLASVVNDIPEVSVFRLTYGGKDFLDGQAGRIAQLIRDRNAITMGNGLYNDDPRPGQRKQGCIIWQRRGERVQRVDPWEGEVVRF